MTSPWFALAALAFVSSITPGPNNLLATSSGARFGVRRTLPQIAGVTSGFVVLLATTAAGLGRLVAAYPTAAAAATAAGYAYLVWLAGRAFVAALGPVAARPDGKAAARPLTFVEAALFQGANPKAWMMALSAASGVTGTALPPMAGIAALCGLYAAINFPCVTAWAVAGARLAGWLHDHAAPWRLRAFDAVMGTALLATVGWMAATR